MAERSWQLMQGDQLMGTLTQKEADMFWTDCGFVPGPGWADLKPLFAASRDAWRSGNRKAASETDEMIHAQGLVLTPDGGGPPLTEFLIRINGDKARFRS